MHLVASFLEMLLQDQICHVSALGTVGAVQEEEKFTAKSQNMTNLLRRLGGLP